MQDFGGGGWKGAQLMPGSVDAANNDTNQWASEGGFANCRVIKV